MPSTVPDSFYLDGLSREEHRTVRPHPPAPLFPLAVGLVIGIIADAAWALGTTVYISVFIAAGVGVWLSIRAAARGARSDSEAERRHSMSGFARAGSPRLLESSPQLFANLPQLLTNVLLAVCAAAGGGMLHDARFRHLPDNHIARYVAGDPVITSLTGRIVTTPRLVEPAPFSISGILERPPRTKFIIALEQAESDGGPVELTGMLEITIAEPVFDLYSGDRVRLFGGLYKPRPPNNPGEFDWALAKRRRGIYAGLSCRYAEAIQKLPESGDGWRKMLSRLRLQAKTLLLDEVLEDQLDRRALVGAMVLGQRSQLDHRTYETFKRTGTSHFLALSGMHIGLLAFVVWLCGRSIGMSSRSTAVVVALVLIVYALLVEPRPSVIRATIISLVFCFGLILRKPVNLLNSISLAALILLLWSPLQLFMPGFQLSFAVALGVSYLTPAIGESVRIWTAERRPLPGSISMGRKIGVAPPAGTRSYLWSRLRAGIRRYVLFSLIVSLAAWLVGSPLAAYHFNCFFTFGWPFTAIVLPFVFLVMTSGFAKLLSGLCWPSSAVVFGPILEWCTNALLWVVHWLAQVPAAMIEVPIPAGWWMVLYYALMLAVVFWRSPKLAGAVRMSAKVPAMLAAVVVVTAVPSFLHAVPDSELRITVLAVGPGSATIIETPDGHVYLYDAGSLADYDAGRMTVMPALRERGIRRIDAAIISHPNYDHYSGLFSLCDLVHIDSVLLTPHFERLGKPGEPDHLLLERFRDRGILIEQCQAGNPRNEAVAPLLEHLQAEILWPPADLPAGTTANDTSLVIRLTHGGRSILLTGDIERYAQEQLLTSGVDLRADVLLLPHHGSVHSATARFIEAVRPSYVIRSGRRRSGPMAEALNEIIADYRFFNTAEHGAVTVSLHERKLAVESFLSPDQGALTAAARKSGRNWE